MTEPTVVQDQSPKRQALSRDCVQLASRLLDTMAALQQRANEHQQAGNFVQEDFAAPDLAHLTPAMMGILLEESVPRILETFATESFPGGATVEEILLQVRT